MSNKQDFEEATSLADSLLLRTQDGKIEWSVYGQDEFIYATPTGVTFLVSASPQGYGFRMQDKADRQLIGIITDPNKEYWQMADGEQGISRVIQDLYDAARRSALKVEEKVSAISEYLNSL